MYAAILEWMCKLKKKKTKLSEIDLLKYGRMTLIHVSNIIQSENRLLFFLFFIFFFFFEREREGKKS